MVPTRRAELIKEILVAIQDEQTQNAFLSNAIAERLDVTSNELEVILEYLRISYEFTKRHTERVESMSDRVQLPKRRVNIKAKVLGQKVRIRF